LRFVQVIAVIQLAVMGALAYGMWDAGKRIGQTTGEVNGLRENIQDLFSSNVPIAERLQGALERANKSADKLNSSLEGESGINAQIDEAMGRMKTEIPKTMERFFDERGSELMQASMDDQAFKDQLTGTIKEAMNDPSVTEAMQESVKKAMLANIGKSKKD
jgi:hypothetical protein